MALLGLGKEAGAEPLVEGAFGPKEMNAAARVDPEIAGGDPAAGGFAVGNFHPGPERLAGDVGRPGEEEPAEIVISVAASEFFFEGAPLRVGFDDVADTAEKGGAVDEAG
jgi:hypothetical protein